MDATLQKSYEGSCTHEEVKPVERGGQYNPSASSDQETHVLLRLLEFRQKELEAKFRAFMEDQNGRGGDREKAIIMEQRINSAMCVGKWLAGIIAALFIIFAAWVTFQVWSVRDRDLIRQSIPHQQQMPTVRPSP